MPPSAVVQALGLIILKPAPPAIVFRNWETKFKCFDTFDGGFSKAAKLCALEQLLKVHGGKIFSNVHSNQDIPGTGDHSWVGTSPNQSGPLVSRKSQMGDAESRAVIKIRE